MADHNKNNSSGNESSFEMLAMPYDEFDIMLTDINEEELERIGREEDVENLSVGIFRSPAFPVRGILHGPNSRFVVPLVFQRAGRPNSPIINVWCLADTGSSFTCLTVKTLEAFVGMGNVIHGQYYRFAIQDPSIQIECQVSKSGSHFEHVNILGVNAMRRLKLAFDIDWDSDVFMLIKK